MLYYNAELGRVLRCENNVAQRLLLTEVTHRQTPIQHVDSVTQFNMLHQNAELGPVVHCEHYMPLILLLNETIV